MPCIKLTWQQARLAYKRKGETSSYKTIQQMLSAELSTHECNELVATKLLIPVPIYPHGKTATTEAHDKDAVTSLRNVDQPGCGVLQEMQIPRSRLRRSIGRIAGVILLEAIKLVHFKTDITLGCLAVCEVYDCWF